MRRVVYPRTVWEQHSALAVLDRLDVHKMQVRCGRIE
jgi:hypothetical protein